MTAKFAAAILFLAGAPVLAHRLDEYLEATLISVDEGTVHAQITLTPGVAVFPILISDIDTNRDGAISAGEQRAYAARVMGDLSFAIDGYRLTPRLVSAQFPSVDQMKQGLGEIQLELAAELPRGGRHRQLTLENHHHSRIAAYQVNCLVPHDPHIRIAAQKRNYSQSLYELDYEQTGVHSDLLSPGSWFGRLAWLSPIAILLFARFTLLWRQRIIDIKS